MKSTTYLLIGGGLASAKPLSNFWTMISTSPSPLSPRSLTYPTTPSKEFLRGRSSHSVVVVPR